MQNLRSLYSWAAFYFNRAWSLVDIPNSGILTTHTHLHTRTYIHKYIFIHTYIYTHIYPSS